MLTSDCGTTKSYHAGCKCEACRAAWARYMREWNVKNPEKKRERDRQYYAANRDKVRAAQAVYAAENGDKKRASDAAYRAGNREKLRLKDAAYFAANRERSNEQRRERYEANRPAEIASRREHYNNNREMYIAAAHLRRARERNATVDGVAVTAALIDERMAYWGYRCWMCGGPFEHVDHVKPIARGGLHVLANLRPACASCNLRKHDSWPVPDRLVVGGGS